MKKIIIIYLMLGLFTTVLNAYNGCSQEGRLYTYNELEKDVKYLLKSLPAFSPKEKEFFDKAWREYGKGKVKKYKRILRSNDFIAYSNSVHLEDLYEDVENIIESLKNKDLDTEIKLIFSINNNILDNTQFFGSYCDSKSMYANGVVDTKYLKIAEGLSWHPIMINECGYSIVKKLIINTKK